MSFRIKFAAFTSCWLETGCVCALLGTIVSVHVFSSRRRYAKDESHLIRRRIKLEARERRGIERGVAIPLVEKPLEMDIFFSLVAAIVLLSVIPRVRVTGGMCLTPKVGVGAVIDRWSGRGVVHRSQCAALSPTTIWRNPPRFSSIKRRFASPMKSMEPLVLMLAS